MTDLGLLAVPAFALLMFVEWLDARRNRDGPSGFSARDTTTNWITYGLDLVSKPLLQYALPFSTIVAASSLTPLRLPADRWWVWVAGLVVTDFCYYWAHRADHRIRLLWTAHSVHHSSTYFNLSTAIRLPWLNPVASIPRSLAWVPAALLGFPVWMIFLLITLGLLYQFPIHTQRVKTLWAPLEFVFNTPAHHRVHHGSNTPYIDRNYGGVFIVWDRLFGTFAAESEPIRYGLTKNIGTDHPVKVNYHEFAALVGDVRRARSWRGRLGYVFGPPGWSEPARPKPERVAA
ncbi:sterol desaturase family protein [Nocardia sp. CDC159]|uniref:Sterol desaturase family protein n=1 Tax=Nocardia pulmonis TaxID=2951408 RepID=A0A9X2E6N3_9NOCA|nr:MULTISPECIES: sterol desaturase family protein [Nocardia]MCM6772483.1 sterol desaturase family protein [Nocardia pulmonis]MCM6784859.1 sterol desaturase family protein [Nocardia sp. CDC159]